MSEKIEKLQELSRSTLSAYINKAAKSKVKTNKKMTNRYSGIQKAGKKLRTESIADMILSKDYTNAQSEIVSQIQSAVAEKLADLKASIAESLFLGELSKGTLGRYVKKAKYEYADGMAETDKSYKKMDKNVARKFINRGAGIDKAVDKLTK